MSDPNIEQQAMDTLAAAEASAHEADTAAYHSHLELQEARALYQQTVADAQAVLDLAEAEHAGVVAKASALHSEVATAKRALRRARGQFDE
jgi:F0F1-type ATP synthase membrane subunit b/b'